VEAKRLLDEALAMAPVELREPMCQHLGVNREIVAAWRGETGEKPDDPPDDDHGPRGTESMTRIGPPE
jgi:hypothetical protein